jgi:tetratricopeptide (TPR) repeat protein
LLSSRPHRLPAFLLLLFLIGGGTFFATNYLAKTVTYVHRADETANGGGLQYNVRGDLWLAAAQMWRDNFWWGAGPAHYNYRFPAYRSQSVQAQPDRAHNDYLNLLADWGTAGGIITLAGMGVFAAGLWQARKKVRRVEKAFESSNSNRFAFYAGASAALLALAVHSAVDFNLHIPANAIIGVTLLALLSSNLRFATEKFWFNLRLPLKMFATVALAAGILYLSVQEFRRGHETSWLARAEQLPLFSPERAAALEKAFAAEPQNYQTAYAIGECYRMQSFDGGQNYEELAKAAQGWYERSWKLNRYDAYSCLRYGMCLDWLDRHDEAGPYFNHADTLDPNNYFIGANIGWHYAQAGDYAAARPWLQRSLRLQLHGNPIAESYLALVEKKLVENASGKSKLPAGF